MTFQFQATLRDDHRWRSMGWDSQALYRQPVWIDFVFSFFADVVVHEDHTFILVVSLRKRYFLALLPTCRLFFTHPQKQFSKDDLHRKSCVFQFVSKEKHVDQTGKTCNPSRFCWITPVIVIGVRSTSRPWEMATTSRGTQECPSRYRIATCTTSAVPKPVHRNVMFYYSRCIRISGFSQRAMAHWAVLDPLVSIINK